MIRVASVVEGDGEVMALPVLLRRLAQWRTPSIDAQVLPPIRVAKDRFLNRPLEFARHLQLAAAKCGDQGWVLLLLDADDDCPATKGAEVAARAREILPHRRVAVVLANREYEAWFLAAAASLNGCRGFGFDGGNAAVDAERPRNAKGWMAQRMASRVYRETTDQAAFSAVVDLDMAFANSRSFRKLCSEWSKNTSHASSLK